MMRRIAIRCATRAARVLKGILAGVAILSGITVVVGVLYLLSEPFYTFGEWYFDNNVFPKALILVVAALIAAVANQIKRNLAEQAKRQEPRSIGRALTQAEREQVAEMIMGWLTWMALTAGAIALGQIVKLFQILNCPM